MYVFRMLGTLIFTLICHHEPLVSGAHPRPLVVPSERNQNLFPRTLSTLASRANLGIKSSLRVNAEQDLVTAKGVKLRRMIQTYGGYEVYGSTVAAEVTMGGQYTGQLSGEMVIDLSDDIPDPEICKRSFSEMLVTAVASEGYSLSDHRVQDKDGRRVVYIKPDNFKGTMAYMVYFFIEGTTSKPMYIIDACDDTIYKVYNLITNATIHKNSHAKRRELNKAACGKCSPKVPGSGGNQRIGRTKYNVPPLCLKPSQSGLTCKMESQYGKIVNNMGSSSQSKSTPISFTCASGYTDPYGNRNGAYGVANDALYFSQVIGDFYAKKYSYNALSWVPRLVVHYGSNYENAFWTGTDMFFGDGAGTFYPLVCLDVTAHELAHGITSTNSNLEYSGQSGGINEAFSDISGDVAEHYSKGSNDWEIGADIMKDGTSLRYFENPNKDGVSVKHTRDYYNGMNVHYSSGIFNHAFWRMVKVLGMPIYDAYKCFLDANRSRWGRNTGFTTGACHVARACYSNGFNHNHVMTAFTSVGISFSGCSLSLHEATVFSGQSRPNILVRKTRSPILELNLDKGISTIEASAEDKSDVTMFLARDEEAEEVIDEKVNKLVVDSAKDANIFYLQLKCQSDDDLSIELVIKGPE